MMLSGEAGGLTGIKKKGIRKAWAKLGVKERKEGVRYVRPGLPGAG